jgi:hypothetical protein
MGTVREKAQVRVLVKVMASGLAKARATEALALAAA